MFYKETRKDEIVILTILDVLLNKCDGVDPVDKQRIRRDLNTSRLTHVSIINENGNLGVEYENPENASMEEVTYLIRSTLNSIIKKDYLYVYLLSPLLMLGFGYHHIPENSETVVMLKMFIKMRTLNTDNFIFKVGTNVKNFEYEFKYHKDSNDMEYIHIQQNVRYHSGWLLKEDIVSGMRITNELTTACCKTKEKGLETTLNLFYFYINFKSFMTKTTKKVKTDLFRYPDMHKWLIKTITKTYCTTPNLTKLNDNLNKLEKLDILTFKISKPWKLLTKLVHSQKDKLTYTLNINLVMLNKKFTDCNVTRAMVSIVLNQGFSINDIKMTTVCDKGMSDVINNYILYNLVFLINGGDCQVELSKDVKCFQTKTLIRLSYRGYENSNVSDLIGDLYLKDPLKFDLNTFSSISKDRTATIALISSILSEKNINVKTVEFLNPGLYGVYYYITTEFNVRMLLSSSVELITREDNDRVIVLGVKLLY